MIRFKFKVFATLIVLAILFAAQTAFAADKVSWQKSIDTSYDKSIPGTILPYRNALYAGGMDLYANRMTDDKNSADIVFDPYEKIGARDIIDLGKISFDSVDIIPDSGYATEYSASVGHVYIVSTHKGEFAKVLVKSILSSSVSIKYSIIDQTAPDNSAKQGDDTKNKIVDTYEFEEGTAVAISWPPFSKQDWEYDLYRSDNGADFVKVSDFKLREASFTDKYCLANHTYLYKYIAYDIGGNVLCESQPIKVFINPKKNNSLNIKIQLGSNKASVNGTETLLDAAPVYVDGRTLVPIRFIADVLGAKTDWNASERSVSIKYNGDNLILWIDKSTAQLNGKTITLDVPAQIINSRMMVPIRFVSENLKLKVDFDSATKTISITRAMDTDTSQNDTSQDNTNLSSLVGKVWDLIMDMGLPDGTLVLSGDGTYLWDNPYSGPYTEKWTVESGTVTLHNFGYNHDKGMIITQDGKGGIYIMVPGGASGNDYYTGTLAK